MTAQLHGSTHTLNPSRTKLVVSVVRRSISIRCLKSRLCTSSGCLWRFPTLKGCSKSVNSTRTQNSETDQHDQTRPLKNFHADIWCDSFLSYSPKEDEIAHARKKTGIDQLKNHVRNELVAADPTKNSTGRRLDLIDNIQRLGLAYHFENEIEEILKHVYETSSDQENDDLYTASLRFRLLRQQGFDSSSGVFNKYTYVNGKFKESLVGDIKGMLSLYEAANLGKPEGDEVLDQALTFTITHLTSLAAGNVSSSDPFVREIVKDALKFPLLKNMPRLEARRYIRVYEQDDSHNKDLLKLAKLDFNLLQSLHREELSDLVRWWKDLDTERKFPYARSRIVELYFLSHGLKFEPQYRFSRNILTKVNAVSSLIDDMYDNYATYEEVKLFTDAVERWNINCVEQLPENLKQLYRVLLNTCNEIKQALARQDQSHRIHYIKRGLAGFVLALFQEAKWLKEGYVPTMDGYMHNAVQTVGYYRTVITFFVGMEDLSVTKEALEWVENNSRIVAAGAYMSRLINDLASHKREQNPSVVEVYMKEYNLSEKEEAIDELYHQLDKGWKVHNEEIIRKPVPMTLLNVVLNLSRDVNVIYSGGEDGYSNGVAIKEIIRSLFIDPVAM